MRDQVWSHETGKKESRTYRRIFGPIPVSRAVRDDGLRDWGDRLVSWKKEPGGILSRLGTAGVRTGRVLDQEREPVSGERMPRFKPKLTYPEQGE